jgi:FKBP-type peptidyl-prolyl cis-trans isomerase
LDRRKALQKAAAALVTTTATSSLLEPLPALADIEGVASVSRDTSAPESKSQNVDGKSVTVFKTKSGLQYIDLVEGTGATPKYGNFVSISYKAYVKLPDIQGKASKLDQFDSDSAYLIKHGNGRTVPGLDEGLHTMKVGGKRRIIVPPKLGYVTSGLGPLPPGPLGRRKLNQLLDQMVELKGGNVVFDVEMRSIIEDEADQGYYDDDSLSPEDFNTLRQNLEASQQAARGT